MMRKSQKVKSTITAKAIVAARTTLALLALLASGTLVGYAQISPALEFEVASVKLAAPDDDAPSFIRGGPGTPYPERITYERVRLMTMLNVAYGVDFDQISGPAWMEKQFYSIVAKVPPATTEDQVKLMWQHLLAERFHLKTHMIKKYFLAYELVVAKGGSKIGKEAPAKPEPGFPEPKPGEKRGMSIIPPRTLRQTFRNYTMTEFARQVGWPLSTLIGSNSLVLGRVIDRTGLKGEYNFNLEFAGFRGPGGAFPPPLPDGQLDTAPYLIDALRQQLGLVLIERKIALDVLVVDYADRIPVEN